MVTGTTRGADAEGVDSVDTVADRGYTSGCMASAPLISSRLTAEQFAERYHDANGYELVRGELIELPPAGMGHSGSNAQVCILVGAWAKSTGLGRVFVGEAALITERDPDTLRGADLAYYSYERLPKGKRRFGYSTVPPELIVEIVGERGDWKRALKKVGEYLSMGVDRVWLLDAEAESVRVVRPNGPPIELAGDDELRDEVILPGFSCRVSELFAD